MMKQTGRWPDAALAGGIGLILWLAAAPAARAQGAVPASTGGDPAGPPRYRMPAVSTQQYLDQATVSFRQITQAAMPNAADRTAVAAAVRALIDRQRLFRGEVARTYPANQFEWLMITDYACDTLATALDPLLEKYSRANPGEILTEGRQILEVALLQIPHPPGRMLGLHVASMTERLLAEADTIYARGLTRDRAGVEDGILRTVQDWVRQYRSFQKTAVDRHTSQLEHEDWVVVRLEDRCGNRGDGVWQLTELFMAMVGVDSTHTPPLEKYAHELHLRSQKCEGDERIVYYDLPYLQYAMMEIGKQAREKDAQMNPGAAPAPSAP